MSPTAVRDALVPRLLERFHGRGLRLGFPPRPVATFPAAHPEVGDATVWDDGSEARVEVGEITHGHFNVYDEGLTDAERHERIALSVVRYLEDLFADRVLLWCSSGPGPRRGGELLIGRAAPSMIRPDDLTFLWSGPAPNPNAR
jgi:hypothetical protein